MHKNLKLRKFMTQMNGRGPEDQTKCFISELLLGSKHQ